MTPEERYELITRNLQEVIGEDELKEKLKSKKEFSVYWEQCQRAASLLHTFSLTAKNTQIY